MRRVVTRTCPGETGKPSKIAKAKSFEQSQLPAEMARNGDSVGFMSG
jgi:hypothetical protein